MQKSMIFAAFLEVVVLIAIYHTINYSEGFSGALVARNAEIEYGDYDYKKKTNFCQVKGLDGMTVRGSGYLESTEGIYPGKHLVQIGSHIGPGGRIYNVKGDCPYSYTDKVNVYLGN